MKFDDRGFFKSYESQQNKQAILKLRLLYENGFIMTLVPMRLFFKENLLLYTLCIVHATQGYEG